MKTEQTKTALARLHTILENAHLPWITELKGRAFAYIGTYDAPGRPSGSREGVLILVGTITGIHFRRDNEDTTLGLTVSVDAGGSVVGADIYSSTRIILDHSHGNEWIVNVGPMDGTKPVFAYGELRVEDGMHPLIVG